MNKMNITRSHRTDNKNQGFSDNISYNNYIQNQQISSMRQPTNGQMILSDENRSNYQGKSSFRSQNNFNRIEYLEK